MDLFTLAAAIQSVTAPKADRAVRKELFPKLQTSRSYSDAKVQALPVKPMLMKYKFGEDRGNWIMKYYVQWPMGWGGWKTVTEPQMAKIAMDHLAANSNRDERYVDVVRADNTYIIYHFNVERWMKDNFSGGPRYSPPTSLVFKFRQLVPRMIYANASLIDLADFIEREFKLYLRVNKRKLYDNHFRFLKLITPDIFDYKLDWREAWIRASIKYSVIIGALALYAAYQHRKALDKGELADIKTRVSNLGDVGKLDRFLRGLR